MTDAVSRLRERAQSEATVFALNTKCQLLRKELAECQARDVKLREALEEYVYQEGATIQAQEVLDMPHDDTALREYTEYSLNKLPEMALLNQIGDLLEPVDYHGSYVDGIKAMVKQAKREVLLDAADRVSAARSQPGNEWGEGYTTASIDHEAWLRSMAEEIK